VNHNKLQQLQDLLYFLRLDQDKHDKQQHQYLLNVLDQSLHHQKLVELLKSNLLHQEQLLKGL
jgi:hypothetical protein